MGKFRIGVQLQPQHTSYASIAAAARRADEMGVDTIWVWDHFYPLSGDPGGNHFEAYTLLAALAAQTLLFLYQYQQYTSNNTIVHY